VKIRSNENISDKELLQRYYADHDQHWLGVLLERYTLLLFGVCMKYLKNETEARDCVQQVFLKVLTEAPKYKVDYFKSWLYIIAKNHCLMKLRNKNSRSEKELKESMGLVSEERQKQEFEEKELTYQELEKAIEELAEEQKQCVILFYLQKNSYQQIVEKTGYSILQVKSFIQNGKRNLRIILEKRLKNKGKQQNEW
jgi:RNA polymerase sigma factor (sigma-70 family)